MTKRKNKPKPTPKGYEPELWRTAMYQCSNHVDLAKERYERVLRLAKYHELKEPLEASDEEAK